MASQLSGCDFLDVEQSRPPGGTPYDGLYGEAPPERGRIK